MHRRVIVVMDVGLISFQKCTGLSWIGEWCAAAISARPCQNQIFPGNTPGFQCKIYKMSTQIKSTKPTLLNHPCLANQFFEHIGFFNFRRHTSVIIKEVVEGGSA